MQRSVSRHMSCHRILSACGFLLTACAATAEGIPALEELLAIHKTNRSHISAGVLKYTLDRKDSANRLQQMEAERTAELRQHMADIRDDKKMDPKQKERWLAAMQDSLDAVHLHALVVHKLRFGSFRILLSFDHGKRCALSSKEDDRDLKKVLESARGNGVERFRLYSRIQRLRTGDRITIVYDSCYGKQAAETTMIPGAKLEEEQILDFGFLEASDIPSLFKYDCSINWSTEDTDILIVDFQERNGPVRIRFALSKVHAFRIVQIWKHSGKKLLRHDQFRYMIANESVFLKSATRVDYGSDGKEVERAEWTVDEFHASKGLSDQFLTISMKEGVPIYDFVLKRLVDERHRIQPDEDIFDADLEDAIHSIRTNEVMENDPWLGKQKKALPEPMGQE